MRAVISGYKIKEIYIRWVQDRLEGLPTGIGNGSFGEAVDLISIIGRFSEKILFGDPFTPKIFRFEAVDRGGIALQGHPPLETVVKTAEKGLLS